MSEASQKLTKNENSKGQTPSEKNLKKQLRREEKVLKKAKEREDKQLHHEAKAQEKADRKADAQWEKQQRMEEKHASPAYRAKQEKKARMRKKNEPPRRSILEEVGNAVTHGVGALMSIIGLVLLLLRSDTPLKRFAAILYSTCLILLYLMSCLYHAFPAGTTVKRLWRRFDYSSIYLLIGGTFAPIFLVWWQSPLALPLFLVQWVLIILGVTIIGVFGPATLKAVHTAMYIIMGWSALLFLPDMVRDSMPLFLLILSGGIFYTL
ncbi:MAG: hemolysin III family protein, partial [Clostridia bacterium]|nr:hemolysin III family protein [Clostridia bacterium]